MAYPDDRYLVATGNWNNPACWSDSSGGSAGASVPTSSNNVFLDANSGASTTLTVNVASSCLNFDCTGFTGKLAGIYALSVWGTVFKLSAGMTQISSLPYTFRATSGITAITTNSKTLSGTLEFSGAGGTFQLQDKLTYWANTLILSYGTFDPNGQDVLLNGNAQSINGAFTFYNLERKPASASNARRITINTNITVTNDLILDSNSTDADKRLLVTSDTRGAARTITCNGTVTAKYCDFEDITGAGDADWDLSAADGGSGDCGGNTDIDFTTAATVYQVGTGNHSFSAAAWKTASNGATAARRPLPQDTAVLDASSTTGTMTQNLQRIGSTSAAAFTGTLTTSTICTCYGSITLGSGLTLTASAHAYTLAGRGTHTLTSAGKEWGKNFLIDAPGGSYSLADNFLATSGALLGVTRGTFSANNFDVTVGRFSDTGLQVRTVTMGSGTWTITGVALYTTIIDSGTITNLTFNKDTALVKIASTLTANRTASLGSRTYYNFENATSGNFAVIIRGGPTFNQFKANPGSKTRFYRGETVTATTWELEGTEANPIELSSDTTSAATVTKAGGGTVTADYATISYLNATPYEDDPEEFFWFATNSTNGGNNTGWSFLSASTGLKILGVQSPAKVNGVALPRKINGVMV